EQRLLHLLDRRVDEFGGVVGDGRLHAGRQLALDIGERLAHVANDGQRVRGGRGEDADEYRLELIEHGGGIGVLGPQLDGGDVVEADQHAAAGGHHELAEGRGAVERGLGVDVGLYEAALYLPRRRDEVVGR